MGHKNKKSLTRQVQERYDSMLAIGQPKHRDKRLGLAEFNIYSWNTYRTYMRHANYFVEWCKENYGCKTLNECRVHAVEWMQTRSGLSPYTQKMEASALAKLYHSSAAAMGLETAAVSRSAIKRSRGDAIRDRSFNEALHSDLVEFCRSVGCRRSELAQLRGNALTLHNGVWCIHFTQATKGGRERYAPVCGDLGLVQRVCRAASDGKVIDQLEDSCSVPQAADIHSFRADYATRVYLQNARPVGDLRGVREWYGRVNRTTGEHIEEPALYRLRRDRKGEVLDRAAMLVASRALGHNRVSVVADHYLRLDE